MSKIRDRSEYRKQWYANHPNYNSEYRAAHTEQLKSYEESRANDPQRKSARVKYCREHRREAVARASTWNLVNREKRQPYVRQAVLKRLAIKRNATIGDPKVIQKWIESWQRRPSVVCYWCGDKFPGRKCHADHVVPLSKGGPHSIENLCVSCPTCNYSKNNKLPQVWNLTLEQPRLFL